VSRPLVLALVVAVAASVGCTDDKYIIVTVDRRPAVNNATKLKVLLGNAGSMRTDELDLMGKPFPVTFSIAAPGRTGDLTIGVDALDMNAQLVGRGSTTSTLAMPTAMVMLDSADFVVNTDYANDQFLSDDFEAIGLQLGAMPNGTWTAVYRDSCTSCNIFGRRFDENGTPVSSPLAAGTNSYPISTNQTTASAQAAIATAGTNTAVFWDFTDPSGGAQGVACRTFDMAGTALPNQFTIATDLGTDVVTSAPLSNGNFAVTWNFGTPAVVRTIIAQPGCTTVSVNPITVSTSALAAHRSHVASSNGNVMYAWIVDDNTVHLRPGNNSGPTATPEVTFLNSTATDRIDHVRLTPIGSNFAVVVRWAANNGTGPGKIELYQASMTGTQIGGATLITDQSGSDFASDKAFSVATRSDGTVMIVWHQCTNGTGTCDVFGRLVSASGATVGEAFPLATTTQNDQVNPSVVALPTTFVAAWNDSSMSDPDHSGTAVRARVIYAP
jgi:hypothetical protein